MRREEFSATGDVSLQLVTGSGEIELLPGPADRVTVQLDGGPESDDRVEMIGSHLVVRPPAAGRGKRRFSATDITIHVPAGATVDIHTTAGDVAVSVAVAGLTVVTASGDVRLNDSVELDLDVKTASGDVRTGDVGGTATITTASGDCVVGTVGGDLRFNSASGDLRCGPIEGNAEAKTVSGDVVVGAIRGATFRAHTLSGDVRLGIPSGRLVELHLQTLSGDLINRTSKSSDPAAGRIPLAIEVKSVSGSLRLESG